METKEFKFRFYIIDHYEAIVSGTNDEDKAKEAAGWDNYFVVDSELNTWLKQNSLSEKISKFI